MIEKRGKKQPKKQKNFVSGRSVVCSTLTRSSSRNSMPAGEIASEDRAFCLTRRRRRMMVPKTDDNLGGMSFVVLQIYRRESIRNTKCEVARRGDVTAF